MDCVCLFCQCCFAICLVPLPQDSDFHHHIVSHSGPQAFISANDFSLFIGIRCSRAPALTDLLIASVEMLLPMQPEAEQQLKRWLQSPV